MKINKTEVEKVGSKSNKIESSDLVAQSILTNIYSALKDKERTKNLDSLEKGIIESIENNYLRKENKDAERIRLIIKEAHSILNSAPKWNKEQKELYSTLEKVVFLGMEENEFSNYFKSIETSVGSILQLDFSNKTPFSTLTEDPRNLFNYISMALNMIMEKLEISVISRKALDSLLAPYPEMIIFITDENGNIRFVNNLGETLLNSNLSDLIGTNIQDVIEGYSDSTLLLKGNKKLKSTEVTFSNVRNIEKKYYLSMPESIEHQSEITELVHVLNTRPEPEEREQFDLKLDTQNKIIPLNLIIGATRNLQESLPSNDDHSLWLKMIYDSAWSLKEQTQGSVLSLVQNLPEEYEVIDFKMEIEKTITLLSNQFETGMVSFEIKVPNGLIFMSSPTIIRSLIENCVSNSLKSIGDRVSSKISIEVIDKKDEGISISVKDNGAGISKKMQEKVFDKYDLKEGVTNENNTGFYLVSQIVKKLNGKIDLKSKVRIGTTFRVDLPHIHA